MDYNYYHNRGKYIIDPSYESCFFLHFKENKNKIILKYFKYLFTTIRTLKKTKAKYFQNISNIYLPQVGHYKAKAI